MMSLDLLPKQIIAWADAQPAWRRDLLRRVSSEPLAADAVAEVLALLLKEPGAPEAVALVENDLPGAGAADDAIQLEGLRDVVGVNALAEDSNLRFALEGLTVIFGNCGSGKTGFGRVLARICRAAVVPELHPNAYLNASPKQSVRLKLRRGDEPQDLRLALDEEPPSWLSAVVVFNRDSAQAFVTKGETIEYTPPALQVLTRCSDAQKKLSEVLIARVDAQVIPIEVDASTDVDALVASSKLNDAEEAELHKLTDRLSVLDSDKAPAAISAAQAAADGARSLTKSIKELDADLGAQTEIAIATQRQAVVDAEIAVAQVRQEMQQPGVRPGTGGEQWRAMWEAARTFVAGEFPPAEGDSCPLCQQSVDAQTAARLDRLEAFVISGLQRLLDEARTALEKTTQALPDPEEVKTISVGELAVLEQPMREQVLALLGALTERKNALVNGKAATSVAAASTLTDLDAFVDAQKLRAEELAAMQTGEQVEQVKQRASALALRRDIVAQAAVLRERCRLLQAIKELDTASVTRGHNTLAKAAINDRLVNEVERELEALNGPGADVQAVASGSMGQTVLRVKLRGSTVRPGNVLSEGEHRLVSLAVFFAQLTVRGGHSAIVLDDPVSSLDGPWQEAVSVRLAREARRRQVIIFTHAMGFHAQLTGAAKEQAVGCAFRYLTKEGKRAGVVSHEPPWSRVPLRDRQEELRRRLEDKLVPLWCYNRDKYERDAETWTTDLRKTWEMFVEEHVLNGTVRRYDPRIYIHKLKGVRLPAGLVQKISTGFSHTSDKAHEQPDDLAFAHRPDVLRGRLDELDAVIAHLDNQQGVAAEAAETTNNAVHAAPASKQRKNGGNSDTPALF